MRVVTLPVAGISPNPDQPRKAFAQDALDELAASIEEVGLLQPIVVRERNGGHEIVAGERRWRAATQTSLVEMPCVLIEADDDRTLVLATAENVNRRDMTPVEEATAYQRIVEGQGRTVEQVARLFGKSTSVIQWRIDLLRLDPTILDMLDKGHVTIDTGWYLSQLAGPSQLSVWRRFLNGDYSDEAAMRNAAKAQKQLDAEPAMFLLEPDEVVEKRRTVKALVDKQIENVRRSHEALDKLMDLSDEDLVVGLGQGIGDLAVTLKALEAHARQVRIKVENAEALRVQSR